jgi:hypothetical protein
MKKQADVMAPSISPMEDDCDKACVWLIGCFWPRNLNSSGEYEERGGKHSFPPISEWDISFRLIG